MLSLGNQPGLNDVIFLISQLTITVYFVYTMSTLSGISPHLLQITIAINCNLHNWFWGLTICFRDWHSGLMVVCFQVYERFNNWLMVWRIFWITLLSYFHIHIFTYPFSKPIYLFYFCAYIWFYLPLSALCIASLDYTETEKVTFRFHMSILSCQFLLP